LPAWSKLHPTEQDLDLFDSTVKANYGKFCPYLTRECVVPGSEYTFRKRKKATKSGFFEQTVIINRERWNELPSIPPRSLGTCALVGLGDVLKVEPGWGALIDAHETVIRIGTPPLAGLENIVGGRVDVILCRSLGSREAKPPIEYRNASFMLGCEYNGLNGTSARRWGLPVYWRKGNPNPVRSLPGKMYEMVDPLNNAKKKPRHAMTGLVYAMGILMSGWCSRLDMFGFSPFHGTHYFCGYRTKSQAMKKYYPSHSCAVVKQAHSPALDSWILHRIMKNHPITNACVYL